MGGGLAIVIVAVVFPIGIAACAWQIWRQAQRARGLEGQYEINWRRGLKKEALAVLGMAVFMPLIMLVRGTHSPIYSGSWWATPWPTITTVGLCLAFGLFGWGAHQHSDAMVESLREQRERAELDGPGAPPEAF